jgi:hypothetical protein
MSVRRRISVWGVEGSWFLVRASRVGCRHQALTKLADIPGLFRRRVDLEHDAPTARTRNQERLSIQPLGLEPNPSRPHSDLDFLNCPLLLHAQTRSQASAGIQWASWPSHLTLQPIGLVLGTEIGWPLVASVRTRSRSLTVILLASRGLSTPRPV